MVCMPLFAIAYTVHLPFPVTRGCLSCHASSTGQWAWALT